MDMGMVSENINAIKKQVYAAIVHVLQKLCKTSHDIILEFNTYMKQ